MSRNGKRPGDAAVRGRKSRAAFTLIELMVSMAILGLIMAILFSIFEQVNKAWLNSENRVETFTQARAILDLLSREVSQAVATPTITFYGKDINDIYFVAPLNTDSGGLADLCEVGYEFDPNQLTLRRRFTQSANAAWDFYANPAGWWRTFDTSKDVILADNGILNVSFYYYDANGNAITYGVPVNKLPYSVVISLDAVDSRTFARLKLIPNVGTAWVPITNSTLRSFSTTIYLPNSSP
jgi:prepilin-type N-terminal cleavage/methylation domain-containing protein